MTGYVGGGGLWRIASMSSGCPLFVMYDGRTVRLEMYAIDIHPNVVTFQRLLMHVRWPCATIEEAHVAENMTDGRGFPPNQFNPNA